MFEAIHQELEGLRQDLVEGAAPDHTSALTELRATVPNLQNLATRFTEVVRTGLTEAEDAIALAGRPAALLPTELLDDVRGIGEHVSSLEQRLTALGPSIANLGQTLDAAATGVREDSAASVEVIARLKAELVEAINNMQEACQAGLDGCLSEAKAGLESLGSRAEEDLRIAVEERPQAFLDETVEMLATVLSEQGNLLDRAAEMLKSTVSEAVSDLREHAETQVRTQIDERLRRIVAELLEELASDAVENVMVTQVGMSVTASLAPFLPQLIAARMVLDKVQHLLVVMRMKP